ncbi:MAG: hypothetical protein AB1546_05475 [bacterium]
MIFSSLFGCGCTAQIGNRLSLIGQKRDERRDTNNDSSSATSTE